MLLILKNKNKLLKIGVSNGAIYIPIEADECVVKEVPKNFLPDEAKFVMRIDDLSSLYSNDKEVVVYSDNFELYKYGLEFYLVRCKI